MTPARVTLRAGLTLLDALVEAVGDVGAWCDLIDIPVRTLDFVRPAPAPGDGHVAWYSATTTLVDARIVRAGVHLGQRDGMPFAHVHGLWVGPDGVTHAGHLMPEATVLAEDVSVDVQLIAGARMNSFADEETQFTLFQPVACGTVADANAVLATVRPNEVIDDAIVTIAGQAGFDSAAVIGLGSLVGTVLDGHAGVADYATEVLLTDSNLSQRAPRLNAVTVGFVGLHRSGTLKPRANAVCVTFELLLVRSY